MNFTQKFIPNMFQGQQQRPPQSWGGGMMPGQITPQAKAIDVANNYGNQALARMQGTTRVIYHGLPLDGRTTYNFFEGVNGVQFPFTNIDQNKLNAGEYLSVMYWQLAIIGISVAGAVTSILPAFSNLNMAFGDLSLQVGERTIMKNTKVLTSQGIFNKNARIDSYNVYHSENYPTIQPDLQFVFPLRLNVGTVLANTYLFLMVEGNGSLFAPAYNM